MATPVWQLLAQLDRLHELQAHWAESIDRREALYDEEPSPRPLREAQQVVRQASAARQSAERRAG